MEFTRVGGTFNSKSTLEHLKVNMVCSCCVLCGNDSFLLFSSFIIQLVLCIQIMMRKMSFNSKYCVHAKFFSSRFFFSFCKYIFLNRYASAVHPPYVWFHFSSVWLLLLLLLLLFSFIFVYSTLLLCIFVCITSYTLSRVYDYYYYHYCKFTRF